jgi:hypothetical protein
VLPDVEYLAAAALATLLTWGGIRLSRAMAKRYQFKVFSRGAVAKLLGAIIVWLMAFVLYEPGTASSALVELGAAAFVFGVGVGLPLWLWVQDIRASSFTWGTISFVYQLLFSATVGILLVLLINRANED